MSDLMHRMQQMAQAPGVDIAEGFFALVREIDILRERVDELEENRHDPKQKFLDDAISQYKERPFTPIEKPPNCS